MLNDERSFDVILPLTRRGIDSMEVNVETGPTTSDKIVLCSWY